MQAVDLILYPKWLAPMNQTPANLRDNSNTAAQPTVLLDHACVIEKGKIIAILPRQDCQQQYTAQFEYNLTDHLLLPGLFNAHTHSAMSLLRGYADDYALMTWLQEHIWPAEGKHVSADFVRVGTKLAISEMLRGGTTCFNDMYFFPEVVTQVLSEFSLRGCVSGPILEFPTPWGSDANEYIAKNLELVQEFRDHPMIHAGFGPHAPYTVSDTTFEAIVKQAASQKTWIHTHLHETATEVSDSLRDHGCRPIERLARLGVFSQPSQAVHMTQIIPADLALLAGQKCHLVHCPESNLKLASGFAPWQQWSEQGLGVAIGTDGAASNNDLDMVSELRTGALLAKSVAADAQAIPAYEALYAATRGGANAFGLKQLGSLQVGFAADVIAVDLNQYNTQPVYEPIKQFVYAANSRQISHVFVAGRLVCHHGDVQVFDSAELKTEISHWHAQINAPVQGP